MHEWITKWADWALAKGPRGQEAPGRELLYEGAINISCQKVNRITRRRKMTTKEWQMVTKTLKTIDRIQRDSK